MNPSPISQPPKISPLTTILAGILVGAGAVTVGAIAMQDESNRKKVVQIVKKAKTLKNELGQKMMDTVDETKDTIQQKSSDVLEAGKAELVRTVNLKAKDISKNLKPASTSIH